MTKNELIEAVILEKKRQMGNDCAFDLNFFRRKLPSFKKATLEAELAHLKRLPTHHVRYMPH